MECSFDLRVLQNRNEKNHKDMPIQFRSVAGEGVSSRGPLELLKKSPHHNVTPQKVPQTVNLAEAPWTKNKKSKSNVEEVKFESDTKNTKRSTQNKDINLNEKDNTKPENGLPTRTRSGRRVIKPETYSEYIYNIELEKFTKKMQKKTVPRKTMPKKSPNRQKKIGDGLLDEDGSNIKRVQYFQQQLNSEIQRMTELCDYWDKTAKQNVLPETAQGLALAAVGQARLLISSKLQHFASLVARCERPEPGDLLVTPADLHGFWDMVYMQIEDINARFLKLEELRSRDWAEELPGPTAAAPRRAPRRSSRARPRVKPAATGQPRSLREMIAAAPSTPPAAAGGAGAAGFISGRLPVRVATSRFRSTQQYVSNAMLRASQMGRDVELEPLLHTSIQMTPVSQSTEPGRRPQRSISRSVKKIDFFDDSVTNSDEPRDKEEKAKEKKTTPNIAKPRDTVEELPADSGLSSMDMEEEGQNIENKSKIKLRDNPVENRSTIMTRRRRKFLDTLRVQNEAPPKSDAETEAIITPKSSARKKKPLQEARELNSEAPAPRRSCRQRSKSAVSGVAMK